MIKALAWTGVAAALLLLAYGACANGRSTAQHAVPKDVDLAGVATARAPSTFRFAGVVNSGERNWFGGQTTTLEYHLDTQRLSFRLEAQQHNKIGGQRADPVLLDLTLYERTVPAASIAEVVSTTIGRFYPPLDDRARLAARFAGVGWQPDIADAAAITRSANVAAQSDDAARWLVIHTDPVRRVRVDLYVWQTLYTLDDARALARDVAASVRAAPGVQAHFDGIATFDQRMAARHDRTVQSAAAALGACGVARLAAGETTFGTDCAAWLSPSRRNLRVARMLGRVPRAAASSRAGLAPSFRLAERLGNTGIATFYWDAPRSRWLIEGLQSSIYEDDDRENPLTAAIAARLNDRANVYLVRFVHHDLQFHAGRVDLPAFLAESARHEAALQAGKVIDSVPAAGFRFDR